VFKCENASNLFVCSFACLFFFSGQLGDVKLEDLPGPEALLRPGTAKYSVQHSSKLETTNNHRADQNTNKELNTHSSKRLVKPSYMYM